MTTSSIPVCRYQLVSLAERMRVAATEALPIDVSTADVMAVEQASRLLRAGDLPSIKRASSHIEPRT